MVLSSFYIKKSLDSHFFFFFTILCLSLMLANGYQLLDIRTFLENVSSTSFCKTRNQFVHSFIQQIFIICLLHAMNSLSAGGKS